MLHALTTTSLVQDFIWTRLAPIFPHALRYFDLASPTDTIFYLGDYPCKLPYFSHY
jgi:hypothetical protein